MAARRLALGDCDDLLFGAADSERSEHVGDAHDPALFLRVKDENSESRSGEDVCTLTIAEEASLDQRIESEKPGTKDKDE